MFILDISTLKAGDVFLTREDAVVSKKVRMYTYGEYSHAMLYVGHGSYIHSDKQGVHSGNIQRLLFSEKGDVKVVRPCNQAAVNAATTYARSQIGKEYSVKEAVKTKLGSLVKGEDNRQFCSRLVAESFSYAGENIIKDVSYCTPEDINNSPAFHGVSDPVRDG